MKTAVALLVSSIVAFVAGAALLVIGIAMPSHGGGGGVLSQVSFSASSDDPDDHAFEDGRPVGLYFMTRYWMATASLEKAVWYFTSDGRVFVDPKEGFGDESLAKHEGRHGTVSADGKDLVVKWSNGSETRSRLEKDGEAFNWDMGIFTPVEKFGGKSELVGKWEGGNSVSAGGGTAIASNEFDLRDDGTFTREGVATIRSESNDSEVSGGAESTKTGRWELDGYVLTMTYDDGRVVRGITFPYDDDNGKTKRMFFAGTMYSAQ